MKTVTPDASWRTVTPGHPALPVELRLPASLQGTLYPQSASRAAYVVAPTDESALATLQVAVDAVDGPEAFEETVKAYGTTLDDAVVTDAELDGAPGKALCATLATAQPGAVIQTPEGLAGQPPGTKIERFRSVYIKRGEAVVRVGYRIPEDEAARWQAVMEAVIGTVRWRP